MFLPIAGLGINPIMLVVVGVPMIIVIILVTTMGRKKAMKPDMYALLIDETDGTISLMKLLKIEDRVYASIDTSYPLFLVVPPDIKSYQCYVGKSKVPCFLAYARGLLALPLDPKIVSTLSDLLSTDDLEKIRNEDAVKVLRYLYDLEEEKIGRIRISAPCVLAIAFNVKRVIQEIINKVFLGASQTVSHFFASARNMENLRRYLEALGMYAEKRHSWLMYIAIIIMTVGIALAIILGVIPFGR